jgi:hypothetical protein
MSFAAMEPCAIAGPNIGPAPSIQSLDHTPIPLQHTLELVCEESTKGCPVCPLSCIRPFPYMSALVGRGSCLASECNVA